MPVGLGQRRLVVHRPQHRAFVTVSGMLNGFRRAVIDARTEGQALAQATADDLKQQGRHAAIGSGFGAGAALLTIFAIGFLLATITYLLSLFLPTWLALTIMTLALFGPVAALVFLARSQFRKVPGVPQPAVRGPQ